MAGSGYGWAATGIDSTERDLLLYKSCAEDAKGFLVDLALVGLLPREAAFPLDWYFS